MFLMKNKDTTNFPNGKKGHYKLSNEESGHYKLSDEKSGH